MVLPGQSKVRVNGLRSTSPLSGLLHPPELPVTARVALTDVGSFLFPPVDFVLLEGREHTQFVSLSSAAPGPGPGIQRMS